jgi:ribosome-associated translation inhibitor RaiA
MRIIVVKRVFTPNCPDMNNGISFKFNFETDDFSIPHDLLPRVFERIKALQQFNPGYKSFELSLSKPGHEMKTACLTIHGHDSVIREESREDHWEHAIDMVFNQVEASHQNAIKLG